MPNWLEISLPATPDTLDGLTAALTARGFDCFQIEDSRDFLESSPRWDMTDAALREHFREICRVIVYLPDCPDSLPRLALLRTLCPGLTETVRAEEDWAENWKRYYKPLPIGRRLLIQPAWLPPDNPENRAVFRNNPGPAFGTGLHASTQLCLRFLESGDTAGKRVLDIGCGSGILALCALCLGAENAVGVDIDPLCASVATENAAQNDLSARFAAHTGDFIEDEGLRAALGGGYDVIFSNIVADVVIALAPLIRAHLAAGGVWIASGIIDTRLEDVAAAASAAGFAVTERAAAEGWEGIQLTINN